MTLLIWTLFIAVLLPFIAKIPVVVAMQRLGKYDNNHPRSQQEKLSGLGARALAAHQNAFESLIIFCPAILIAVATNHTGELIQQAAITYLIARVIYNLLYLLNFSTLRSFVWAISLFCPVYIIWLCIP
ncbi:MAPEG family protein [Pseudocolwellia agarivorans]|uniref:MAPEG family protein n=1 Tax=Pseudocolwellia agarivorans TaxID=1911682 RepID=UPI0009840CDC|nr:MAPEG family protein [Pseudocolwellia agarivorans]